MPDRDLFASQSDSVKSPSLAPPDIVVRAGLNAVSAFLDWLEAEQAARLCAIDPFLTNMIESIPETRLYWRS